MRKGMFWCVDADAPQPELITVSVSCSADGDTDPSAVFTAKSGMNFNHRAEWEKLDKRVRRGVAYNFYPRGRVEVRNGRTTVFLNPDIDREPVLRAVCEAFELLDEDAPEEIAVKSNGSRHYRYGAQKNARKGVGAWES